MKQPYNKYAQSMLNILSGRLFVVYLGLIIFNISSSLQANTLTADDMSKDTPNDTDYPCMIILGASYAKGWDIEQLYGCRHIQNEGIDGNQSFEMAQRFQQDVLDHQPRYVLLWGFINDIFRSNPEKMESTLQRIRDSYLEMIKLSRAHQISPILATEVTIREPAGIKNAAMKLIGDLLGKTSYQSMINDHVMQTNTWIRQLAAEENIPLLDFETLLAEPDGRRGKVYSKDDGSHITGEAYRVITDYARQQLNP